MKFSLVQTAELPYNLNVPEGNYSVAVGGSLLNHLLILQNQYAGTQGAMEYPTPVSVGTKKQLLDCFGATEGISLVQLHTVARAVTEIEVSETEVDVPTESQMVEEISRNLIRQRTTSAKGEGLEQEAKTCYDQLTETQREQFSASVGFLITARRLFPVVSYSDAFIDIINRFVRKYVAHFSDFFVEEVTIHHLASTGARGIIMNFLKDGYPLEEVTRIGKIPPVMRQPWLVYEPGRIEAFRDCLNESGDADGVALIRNRARLFLERGAGRSAIIEVSAALEATVARRLVRGFTDQGRTESEIRDLLSDKQRFPDRAKGLMRQATGKSLADEDQALWERVVNHRDSFRHKIAHSDAEPTKADAESAVEDMLRLAQVAEKL